MAAFAVPACGSPSCRAATQVDSEATDLDGVHAFMLRQLLCVRLHHVLWPLMLAMNVATIVSFLVCCLLALLGIIGATLAILGVATQTWKLIAFAIIPALYFAGLLIALAAGDRLVRRAVSAPPPPWRPKVDRSCGDRGCESPAMRCSPRRSCARSSGAASPMTSWAATASACDPIVPIARRGRAPRSIV